MRAGGQGGVGLVCRFPSVGLWVGGWLAGRGRGLFYSNIGSVARLPYNRVSLRRVLRYAGVALILDEA